MAKAPNKKSEAVAADDIEPKKKPAKKAAAKPEKEFVGFDVNAYFDEALDLIEKKTKVSSRSMAVRGERLSTGMLALDMYLLGGLVAGSWTTIAGGEQSCKSTTTMTIIAQVIKTACSTRVSIFDYEGCLTGDTPIMIGTSLSDFPAFSPIRSVLACIPNPEDDKFYPVQGTVFTSEGMKKYVAARVRKAKPITKITISGGHELRGYHHPVMVLNTDGLLEWKMIEDLKVGDKVIRSAVC